MAEHRQFSDIFAHAATGYAVTDVKGNVVEVNKAFARIVDRSPAQIGNANLFEWTHPEDQARHQALLARLLASEISQGSLSRSVTYALTVASCGSATRYH